jgi:hypothetical protein
MDDLEKAGGLPITPNSHTKPAAAFAAKSPANRFQSAEELLEAISAFKIPA